MLQRIIYTSQATGHIWLQMAEEIVRTSLRNNHKLDITGCLCCSDQEFLQVLEGPEAAVEALLRTIERDPRHHSLLVSERCAIDFRTFDSWAMGFAPRFPEHEPLFLRYLPKVAMSFKELGPAEHLALLQELIPVADRYTDQILCAESLRAPA